MAVIMKIKFKEIKSYVEKIKKRYNPQKVILFGSYANGKPNEDSDVDLLVIMDTKLRSIQQAVFIRRELPSPFPLDLIVKTSKEAKKRIEKGDFFLKAIFEKGRNL